MVSLAISRPLPVVVATNVPDPFADFEILTNLPVPALGAWLRPDFPAFFADMDEFSFKAKLLLKMHIQRLFRKIQQLDG